MKSINQKEIGKNIVLKKRIKINLKIIMNQINLEKKEAKIIKEFIKKDILRNVQNIALFLEKKEDFSKIMNFC